MPPGSSASGTSASSPSSTPNRHGFDYFRGYLAGYVDWYAHVRGDGQAGPVGERHAVRHDGYLDYELTQPCRGLHRPNTRTVRSSSRWRTARRTGRSSLRIAPRRPRARTARCSSSRPTPIRRAARTTRPSSRTLDAGVGNILEALEVRPRREYAGGLHQRQRRGVALAQRAVLSSQGHGVGGRHPRAGYLPLAGRIAGRADAVARSASRWISRRPSSPLAGASMHGDASRGHRSAADAPRGGAAASGRSSGASTRRRASRARFGAATGSSLLDGSKQLLFDVSTRSGRARRSRGAASGSCARRMKGMIETWEKDVDAEAAASSDAGATLTSPAPGLRWWPAAADRARERCCARLGLVARGGDRQDRVLSTFPIVFATLLLLATWLIFFSRLSRSRRQAGRLAQSIATLVLAVTTTRVRGVTGDLVPIFEFRWASRVAPRLTGAGCGGDAPAAAGASEHVHDEHQLRLRRRPLSRSR